MQFYALELWNNSKTKGKSVSEGECHHSLPTAINLKKKSSTDYLYIKNKEKKKSHPSDMYHKHMTHYFFLLVLLVGKKRVLTKKTQWINCFRYKILPDCQPDILQSRTGT